MKAFNVTLTALALFASSAFAGDIDLAKVANDVARIKQSLPAGVELAGAYQSNYDVPSQKMKIELRAGEAYLTAVSASYTFTDLNRDGAEDLVVAVELAPTTDSEGWMSFGQRTLQVYLAHGHAGDLQLLSEGSKVMLNGDEGGVFGDPLEGIILKKNGAFIVSHYGGSADRWALAQTFQYRNGQIYVIGATSSHYRSPTLKGSTVDTNYLTGDQIITQFDGDKEKVSRRKVKVKPLVALPQATVEP